MLLRSLLPSIAPLQTGLVVPQLVGQKKKKTNRDPSHNSPGQPRGAPSQHRHRCWDGAEPLVIVTELCPCFFWVSHHSCGDFKPPLLSPSTCLYRLKPWLFPRHPPPEYFVSAPVSREQPSARLPPGSLPIYETSHHFFLPALLLLGFFCSAALSCSPASQRNR